ncbi:uncharacterized protein LOC144436622 [Glandiceps talaboti]
MMGYMFDRSHFTIVAVLLVAATSTSTGDTAGAPKNLRFRCPNMNCTITWDPPLDATENETVYYTVRYQSCHKVVKHGLVDKPECFNTTHASCNLGSDLRDPHKYWCAFVKADRNSGGNGGMTDEPAVMHPANDATVEGPELVTVETTSRSIYIEWLAPKTPYGDHHGNLHRVDHFQHVGYNMTYWTEPHPSKAVSFVQNHHQSNHARHALLDSDKLIYPGKKYTIVLQGSINSVYGMATQTTAMTKEEVPGRGVLITNVKTMDLDCVICEDLREATVEWEPLEDEYKNGKLTHQEVEYWIHNQRETAAIRKINIGETSAVLPDISRWKEYDFVVYLCNAVGCTPHTNYPYLIDKDETIM